MTKLAQYRFPVFLADIHGDTALFWKVSIAAQKPFAQEHWNTYLETTNCLFCLFFCSFTFQSFHPHLVPLFICTQCHVNQIFRHGAHLFRNKCCSSWNLSKIECRLSFNDKFCVHFNSCFMFFWALPDKSLLGGKSHFFFLLYYHLTSCKN